MAARDKIESIIRMMDQDNDGEALNALRLLRKMAQKENKNLAEFLLSGSSHRAEPPPRSNYHDGFRSQHQRAAEEYFRQEAERRAKAEAAREAQRRERAARQEERQANKRRSYGDAFDDAEMTDEQRAAARARRAERQKEGPKARRSSFRHERQILDELHDIARTAKRSELSGWEYDFVHSVPDDLQWDDQMTERQRAVADRIIRKFKMNRDEAPI